MNGPLNETQIVINKIIEYCKPDKIILFGSLARGEEKSDSDIDLLIIKDSNKKRAFRIKEVFEAIRGVDRKYPLDPIVYTQQEIGKRLSLGDFFIKKVMEEGKIMYGSK
ncbi:MAG: nucleotidyltransferase domain-containing protein [bacterium]|nr:nucleotidyltransferase domain-containing protein [bacterium]